MHKVCARCLYFFIDELKKWLLVSRPAAHAKARAAPRERTDLNSYTPCPPEATQREGGQTCRKKTHQALRSVTLRSPEATRREGERTLRLNINSTQSQNITNSSQARALVYLRYVGCGYVSDINFCDILISNVTFPAISR